MKRRFEGVKGSGGDKVNGNKRNCEIVNDDTEKDEGNNENQMNKEKESNQENENLENEDNNESGPSTKKKRKRTSPLWNHFSIKVSNVDEKSKFSHCNYCDKKYVYAGKSNGGTGNLKNHLKSAHPEKLPTNLESSEEKIKFSQERYRQALVKWIIASDQPFNVCTEEYFLEMINTLNPDAKTISNQTVKRDIMAIFAGKIGEIKSKMNRAPGKYSFTLDGWTSKNGLPFMAIRAHWIDDDWVYQTVLLDFCYIDGKHDGLNLSYIFIECLKRFDIPLSKVLALTMDNIYSNNTFMDCLGEHGIKFGIHISPSENRVRCMPHILNLVVQDILSSLKIPLNNEEDKYEHLDNQEDNDDAEVMDEEEEEDEDEEELCEVANKENQPTVPKLRKLVKKIRKSTQMRQKLKKLCILYGIESLVPIIDVATRWNSTFNMIERAAYLKVPLRALCSNEKSLKNLLMNETEWTDLNGLKTLLQKFDRSTKLLSMERHSTISAYLPTLNWLLESIQLFIADNSGSLACAAEEGLEKLKKYEKELQIKKSRLPYVATFLNPALKMTYFKEHDYTKPIIREIQKSICEVFEKYETDNNNQCDEKTEEASPDEFFDHMYKRAKANKEPKEFQKYLNFPLSAAKVNVIDYWRSQKEDFPNLSNMARDFLAIQSSSVAVERDFSMGVDLVTPTRCCMLPETIRACMCLKSWFKNLKCGSIQ